MKKLIALIAIFGMLTSISVTASAGLYRPGTRDDDVLFLIEMLNQGVEEAADALRQELRDGGVSEDMAKKVEALLADLENPKEATPEPEQTAAPTPEATPEPTPEATPEPTPEATPEPTPEATPEPTPEATPEPEQTAAPEMEDAISHKVIRIPDETSIPDDTPKTRADFETDEEYNTYYEWYLYGEEREAEIIARENADFPEKLAKWEADANAVKALHICAIVFGCIAIMSFIIGVFFRKNTSFSKNNAKKVLFCIAAFSVLAAVILWAIGFDKEKKMGHKPFLVTDEHVVTTWETGDGYIIENGERYDQWYIWGMEE